MNRNDAKKYLANAPDDRVFWVNNGQILRNLKDLEKCLSTMSVQTYAYHANKEKNDFSNWIGAVIGDKMLAMDIVSARNKESSYKKVKIRIQSLKKMGK